jgi:hypothetical protein
MGRIVVKSRSIKLLLVLSLAVVVLIPVTAVASHQFTDVPNSNIFHADIAWLADNGVTKGCNPPANTMYCPEANVTRQQMAAFMHRLAVNKVVDAKTAVTADSATNADKLDGKDSTAFLGKTEKAADSDKLDGFSYEAIASRAEGVAYERDTGDLDGVYATVSIDAPMSGLIIARAGGDSYFGTGIVVCELLLDDLEFDSAEGYVDHGQHDEADCITSGSVVVDAGVHTVDLFLTGDAIHVGNLWAMWIPFDGAGEEYASASNLEAPAIGEKDRK